MGGGGCVGWLCQNIFMNLKKCWEGYAKIFYGGLKLFGGLKNVWGVCQQILCIDLKKKIGGGGVCGRMPKHFRDLKKMLVGGGGACYAQIFYRLEKMLGGGVCQQIYGLEKC